MTDEELLNLMESMTVFSYGNPISVCDRYPGNWYAYMGLMDTYELKYSPYDLADEWF